ncbi:MAG: hypothetical protein P0S94_04810 [Simkaniaceae bacterium]|nr:hypothetical protein [Simkaniaceae bacterium]
MKRVLLAAVLGGLFIILWELFSWNVIPWYKEAIRPLANEKFVSWIVTENSDDRGIYVLPYPGSKVEKDEQVFIFASISPKGLNMSAPLYYIYASVTQFAIAGVMGWLLTMTRPQNFMRRVWFLLIFNVIAGCAVHVTNAIWWGVSYAYLTVAMSDLIISGFMQALIIASIVKPKEELTNV